MVYDAIVVGGGPAGLSAALLLGRCRRKVLVCDSGHYRNAASHALHGFLSRDGIDPAELRQLARAELEKYETVHVAALEVLEARRIDRGFEIDFADGEHAVGRRLVLATGVVVEVPRFDNAQQFYGCTLFHCPYCDGWERRDQPLAVFGARHEGVALALELTAWTKDLVFCTDGPSEMDYALGERLRRNGIAIREDRVLRLEGTGGLLQRVIFAQGPPLARTAAFFASEQRQRSDLAMRLGCSFTYNGMVNTNEYEATNVPGVFVAGDASGAQFHIAIIGAAEGARAAMAVNTSLLKEDLA